MSTDPAKESKEHLSATNEKARLECEKLKAEIETIRKPFYRTSSFYTAIAPILLAILGLAFSWSSGWFDVQLKQVNNEKVLVQAQTERLQIERTHLEEQTQKQQVHLSALENEIHRLKLDRSNLTNQMAEIKRERDEVRSLKDLFESQAHRLAGSETNALKFLADLQAAQAARRSAIVEGEKFKSTNELLRVSITKRDVLIRRAYDQLRELMHFAVATKPYDARHQELFDKALKLSLEMAAVLPEWQVDPDPSTNTPRTGHQ